MAIATCVFTWRSWFCMSRMTCLIIFSGSSDLSIMSLRLARISVETLSSNAMTKLLGKPPHGFRLSALAASNGQLATVTGDRRLALPPARHQQIGQRDE